LKELDEFYQKLLQLIKQLMNNSIAILLSEKKQIISQTEILEYTSVDEKITNL
jgi:hypothetical protein